MYKNFFGLKEKPFNLAPNPEYLFLSKGHGETLAHLIFAISHGEGAVKLTGEAGTGKTTLCRAVLDNLDESTKAAYISNPKLNALQFLKAINEEFFIDPTPDNTKDLVNILKGFLIKKKAAGQKILLLIDEAQDLPLEVLEQHSLFSNPDPTQEKLLRIILVGQPELDKMLSSPQLKQLGQRITKNFQLGPLTFMETIDYIRHRISHASQKAGPPFDKASCRVIYEYSKGIPLRINIGCDMALQKAFNRNSSKITGAIAREAIKGLTGKKSDKPYRRLKKAPGLAILSAILVPMIIALLYFTTAQSPETAVTGETFTNPKVRAINQGESGKNIPKDMDGHSVHVGTFETASQANWRLKSLKSLGFPSFMYARTNEKGNTVYEVVAGKYESFDLAEEASRSLSEKGHYNFIVTAKNSLDKEPAR